MEKLEGNDKTAGNTLDASITSRGKQFEKTWALKQRTLYPYGFHDQLEDEYKQIYESVDAVEYYFFEQMTKTDAG